MLQSRKQLNTQKRARVCGLLDDKDVRTLSRRDVDRAAAETPLLLERAHMLLT
jgi:hypothetical protein